MSFYDDASLVFLPSGGAGKDGKAYSIKPVPEYGTNLVTNGGFDTDTDWVKGAGWTISGGTANCDGSSNILRQSNAVPLNTKLYVSIEVSNYVSGALQVKFAPVGYPLNVTKNGIYTIVTNGDNSLNTDLQIVSTAFIGSIDNVSVKEVIVGDGDFTFSRGSNLTATRVDSNGLIEKGRENLLLQSNSFDTTWTLANVSATSSQSGYDGSTDAWLITKTTTSSGRVQQSKTSSGVQTFSAYAKKGTLDGVILRIDSTSGNQEVIYNLTSGSVGSSTGGVIDSSIASVGNDWYKIQFTFNTSITAVRIYPSTNTGGITTIGNIYIQDAQLEIGLTSTEYIESGASTGLAGILEDSPRFDYSGGASCPSLLLERSRTNLVEYSEYMLGSNWLGGQTTITPVLSPDLSPEGKLNAYRITRTSSNTQLGSISTVTSGQTYTGSIYIKRVSGSYNARIKVVENTSTTIAITDEWERFDLTAVATSGNGRLYISPFSTGDVIDVWGAQLEEGSYSSSYIPNHSGGSETRDADVTSVTSVSDLIGQTEGTIYCEFEYNGAADSGVFNRIIGLGTGVTQNRILLAKNDTTAELVAFAVSGGTTQVFQAISGTSIIGHHKVAISYKANEYKVYLDGELEFTDSSASVPATTDVYVGTAEDGTTDNELGGVVKQSIIFKEVLSEDNCKALTTL